MTSSSAEKSIEDDLSDLFDDPQFQLLNVRFRGFNIFEALGAVRAEVKHSNFLAFLLSPSQTHGLGSELLIRLLRSILNLVPPSTRPIAILELLTSNFEAAVIHRERWNIDILIEIEQAQLIVVIENKVGAEVSSGQLTQVSA